MTAADRIGIDVFKIITRAVAGSTNLEILGTQLTQLLVGYLKIKGCTIFVLNPHSGELEILSSFGLSADYLNKGPVLFTESLGGPTRSEPVVISDVNATDRLQYPQEARREGLRAIVSLPLKLYGALIGDLRLYHLEPWEVSARDLDTLTVLAENIGLALMYTRLFRVVNEIKGVMDDIHPVWMQPPPAD